MSTVVKRRSDARVDDVKVDASFVTFFLRDGRRVSVPLWWSPILHRATPAQRQKFEIDEDGYGVHWSDIDEDLSGIGALTGTPMPRRVRLPDGDVWTKADIRGLRQAMGLSITDFARRLGVRRATVSDWEHGKRDVSPTSAKLLLDLAWEHEINAIAPEQSIPPQTPCGGVLRSKISHFEVQTSDLKS